MSGQFTNQEWSVTTRGVRVPHLITSMEVPLIASMRWVGTTAKRICRALTRDRHVVLVGEDARYEGGGGVC